MVHSWGARAKVAEAVVLSLLTSLVTFCVPLMFSCKVSSRGGPSVLGWEQWF